MAKTIKFNYNGRDYCLEFTKRTVQEMDRMGFVAKNWEDHPGTVLPQLWSGAFLANNRKTTEATKEEIYANIVDKEGLIEKLIEMYNEPLDKLLEEPPEDAEGNVKWEANW